MKSRGCFKTHNPHQKSDGFSSHHQHPNSIFNTFNFKVNEMTLKNYIFKNLWLQVVISLLVGLVVGLILGTDVGVGLDNESLDSLSLYLEIPANIFLSVILMIIVPLIFASIVVAIANLGGKDKLKTLGLGIGVYFVITTTIAILVAVSLASIIAPGSILDLTALQETHDLSEDDLKVTDGFSLDDIPNAVSRHYSKKSNCFLS